jgi:hypothetical protein
MLRLLAIVACLILTSCASTQTDSYIRVTGEGATQEQAKQNAFREAVQIRVGSVVLSERESSLRKLERDDINVYSAGYVDDYKVVSVERTNGKVKITLDVLVADSKLVNNRLVSGKVTNQIEGDRANTNYRTFMDQKQRGDKLLNSVLKTYPESAYIVQQKNYSVSVNAYRNIVLQVPYKLTWNYDYIVAFNEALNLIQDNKFGYLQPAPSNVIVMAKDPKDFVLGERKHFKFNDVPLLDYMKSMMTDNREIRLMMTLRDSDNRVMYKGCWPIQSTFYVMGEPRNLLIYGNTKEEGILQLVINSEYNQVLEKSRNIEVSVVPRIKC